MSDRETYTCPYPDCDWEIDHPPEIPLSVVAHRVEIQQHRKDHRENRLEDGTHTHVCGYCGREFKPAYENPNPEEPCPQCRSRSKECECRA